MHCLKQNSFFSISRFKTLILKPHKYRAYLLLIEFSRKISEISFDDRESSFFLFQQISVLIHHHKAIMLHEFFFTAENCPN